MIPVTCGCSYRANVPDQFVGKSVKCPKCGSGLGIGSGATAVAVAEPIPVPQPVAASPKTEIVGEDYCSMCEGALARNEKVCRRCGWDAKAEQRKCVKCMMPIMHDDGPGFGSYQFIFGGIGGLVMIRFIGLLGVLGVMCLLGGLSGISAVMLMGYRCSACIHPVNLSTLSRQELEYQRKRRIQFALTSGGLLLGAVVCAILWVVVASL